MISEIAFQEVFQKIGNAVELTITKYWYISLTIYLVLILLAWKYRHTIKMESD